MYQTVSKSDFRDAFQKMGRKDNFSYNALDALYDYLEETGHISENDKGYELDVIALCCEFTEYATLEDFQEDYGEDYETMDSISDRTSVIDVEDGSFVIATF